MRACDEVLNRWRRFVPEHEARAEAERFRRCFENLAAAAPAMTEVELDAVLESVADAMARA